MRFPRMVIPMAISLTALFNLCTNLLAVLVFALASGVSPRLSWLQLPLLVGDAHRAGRRTGDAAVRPLRALPRHQPDLGGLAPAAVLRVARPLRAEHRARRLRAPLAGQPDRGRPHADAPRAARSRRALGRRGDRPQRTAAAARSGSSWGCSRWARGSSRARRHGSRRTCEHGTTRSRTRRTRRASATTRTSSASHRRTRRWPRPRTALTGWTAGEWT